MSFPADKVGSAGVKVARADAPPLIIEGFPDSLPPNSYATARVIVGVAPGTTFVENQLVVPPQERRRSTHRSSAVCPARLTQQPQTSIGSSVASAIFAKLVKASATPCGRTTIRSCTTAPSPRVRNLRTVRKRRAPHPGSAGACSACSMARVKALAV